MKKNRHRQSIIKISFSNIPIMLSLFALLVVGLLIFKNFCNWQFYLTKSIGPNNNLFIYDNLIFDDQSIFFNSQNKTTYSINQETGQINWEFYAENYSPFPPIIDSEQVFLANFDGNIYSLDKKTGYKIWQFNTNEQYQPDTLIVKSPNKEMLFFGSRNGVLYALNSITGKLIWKKQFKEIDTSKVFIDEDIHFGSIYVDKKQIYVSNAVEKKFFVINQTNGNINWEMDNFTFSYESPLFLTNAIILKQNQYLLSIDKYSGSYKKIERIGADDNSWQVFKVKDDNKSILILDNQKLIKINEDFEKEDWSLSGFDNILYSQNNNKISVVETHKNQIYLQKFLKLENINRLFSINYNNGKILWQIDTNGLIRCHAHTDETIFLGKDNGYIFAINIEDKKINWQIQTDGEPIQLFLFQDHLLSINLKPSGKLAINYFNQKTGQERWSYTPDLIVSKNDIYINKDIIYILNKDKKIIEKIKISLNNPNNKKVNKINFSNEEIKDSKDPYLMPKKTSTIFWLIRKKYLRANYLIKNFTNIFSFEINKEIKENVFEISIKNDENLYQNKFVDLKIDAVFNEKNKSEKIKIKGFYYDHNTWKVLFSAPKQAEYDYKIRIRTPYFTKTIEGDVSLNNSQEKKLTINQNSFVLNNEEVFFPIGIQDVFVDRNYNGNLMDMMSNSATPEPVTNRGDYSYLDINNYLDFYKNEAGLNIFRYGVDHWTPPLWHSIDQKNITFSINGAKFGDNLIKKLKDRDFKIIMTIFGFYPPYKTKEEIRKKENQKALTLYLDYVIARFSPYIDLWELMNESEAHYLWYEFVINYLKENDPYHHPISTNWETKTTKNIDFLSVHWYNPDATDPGTLSNQINYLTEKHQNSKQAILISEFGFKNYSYFQDSSESMRILTWLSVFQNMGIIFWSQGQNGIYSDPNNANIYLGPTERSYLLILNNFLPKKLLVPVETSSLLIPNLQSQVYLLQNDDYILGYLLKFNKTKNNQEYLTFNLKKRAKLQWINPKTGLIVEEESLEKDEQKILIPNFDVDLAIKIIYLN